MKTDFLLYLGKVFGIGPRGPIFLEYLFLKVRKKEDGKKKHTGRVRWIWKGGKMMMIIKTMPRFHENYFPRI